MERPMNPYTIDGGHFASHAKQGGKSGGRDSEPPTVGAPVSRVPHRAEVSIMPVHKTKGGYKYGKTGKVYKSKAGAVRQAKAIHASQARRSRRSR
jgi:hypothetical protein